MKIPVSIKILLCALFSLLVFAKNANAQVEMQQKMVTLPTYRVMKPEKAPIFFTNENYQGASRFTYPLALNDVISSEREMVDWKFLTLENEYIKLGITPEIGGKLYYATDKSNGYNFIYKNNEVKPGNLGMTGAWVSGGIEWCVLHHHRASTFLPMDYHMVENTDGGKTIYVGETEPRHSMRWTIGVTVFPGKSYYEAEVAIYNPTPYTHSFLYWANVATHTNENYQVIFPPGVQHVTFHSKNDFSYWPVSTELYRGQDFTSGVDISWWKNVKQSASFFAHDLQEDFMGGYDHGQNSGTVHIGDHNIVKGAKLWEWGSGPRGQATEGRLTETSGPYVEIMVGAFSDNQPDYSWIKPYETKRFKQYWYPVKDIGGFKNANLDAAVNLEKREGSKVFLGYHATSAMENVRIILKKGEEIILEKEISISPEKAFTETVEINGAFDLTELKTELLCPETGKTIISYQPQELEKKPLPPVVEPPKPPEEIGTIEEVYLAGKRIEQFYNPRYNALDYYYEVLKRDQHDIRANKALGNHFLKNGDYEKARKYLSVAAKRVTQDYTRPSNCEVLYLQGLTLKALGLYEEAIDTLYRATWDYAFHSAAYFELAQISCLQGNFKKALQQINESISTNTKNTRAIALKAAIQRKTGDFEGALRTLAGVLEIDPLNFRLSNEMYLLNKEMGNEQKAEEELTGLAKKMRGFDQNYLELAAGYLDDGMPDEATEVLNRIESENPVIHYYLGYIHNKKGDSEKAKEYFNKANSLPEDYCFPYRLKTANILNVALKLNPDDDKAYYYLGNIFYDKQPEKAIQYWEKAVDANPGLAMAWRNLGWGCYRHFNDYETAISNYEKAVEMNGDEAIFYAELDRLYELNNSPVEKRLALFDGKNDVVKKRDDAFVHQTTVLTLAGQPEKAIEYLEGKKFSYREGNSRVREMIIDAQLSLGIKLFTKGNYEEALEHFLLAQIPDEEAGSARSGNRDIQVNYFIGKAYEALKNKKKAREFYNKATSAETVSERGFMSYYKGLGFLQLNKKDQAKEIFEKLVENANNQLDPDADQQDFFAIFGEREAENIRKSAAYTMRGLGYKGLGKIQMAKSDLEKAVELSVGNLWAKTELNEIN